MAQPPPCEWDDEAEWDALIEDPRGDAFVAELFEQAQRGPFRPFPISRAEPL